MNNDFNLLILSGPSGAGKSTLTKYLQEKSQKPIFPFPPPPENPERAKLMACITILSAKKNSSKA